MRWEGHLPNLFTGPGRYLQLQSAASLYLSGASPGFPAAASPLLTSCQRPSVTGICTLNLAHVHVCVCVCAQVCAHTPESLSLERSQGAWGCLKRQPPQDSYLTPLKTCPPSSPCSRDRHLQKARKGYLGDPQLSPACVPHPLLPPPAQGPCSPPRSEFPTGLPASHDSVHTAWGSPGSGKLGHCPLIIHSTEITEYWGAAAGLGTQDTWKAKSVPTSPQTCRQ